MSCDFVYLLLACLCLFLFPLLFFCLSIPVPSFFLYTTFANSFPPTLVLFLSLNPPFNSNTQIIMLEAKLSEAGVFKKVRLETATFS